MKKALDTITLGLAGLGLGLAASALPAAAASGARLELSKDQLALLLGVGLWTRVLTAGFVGALVDRFGGRRALRDASLGAVAAAVGLGLLFLGGREKTLFVGVAILHAALCYFLAFAGPAMAHINAERLEPAQRGRHAGLYGTLAFPAEFLALPAGLWLSARFSSTVLFFLPAAACTIAFIAAWRAPHLSQPQEARSLIAELRALMQNRALRVLAALEVCTGAVRWGLLGWSAQFLSEVHHIRPGEPHFGSALATIAMGATAGPALCGIISDKLFNGRRAPAALVFFIAQAAVLAALGRATDPIHAIICLGLASAASFGIHALLCGAAAMDAGGRRSAATVSGVLDGFHHAAGGLAVLLVAIFVNRHGWGAWTATLIPFSLAGALTTFALRAEAQDPYL